jgi:hypothetical protein
MAALPEHTLYYVITGRTINGPRQFGEVIDVDELGIRNVINTLMSSGSVASVPYGSTFAEVDGITFVNDEFAAEYQAFLNRQEEGTTPAEDPIDGASASDTNDQSSDDDAPSDETPEEVISRLGSLNKVDLTAEAEALGVTVDPDWTKAEIVDAVKALLS